MCTKSVLDSITNSVSDYAKEIFGDKLDKVILYGSYARGTFDEYSDIDLMVLVNIPASEVYENSINKTYIIADKLSLEYDILVSISLQDCETFYRYKEVLPFYSNILNEGVFIYERS